MTRTTTKVAAMLAMLAGAPALAQVSATFQLIPNAASANDLTPDGRFVVGGYDFNGDGFSDAGYRWDRQTGVVTIIESEQLATGGDTVVAVSDDGSTIVGSIPETSIEDFSNQAAIWTDADGWVGLGWLPNAGVCPSRSDGYEISGDGSVVVGLSWDGCSGRGFRWTAESGMEELQSLANGGNRASVLSADGSMIAGFAQGAFNRTPATWDGETLVGTLLDPPNGEIEGEFTGISDDGSIVLGSWGMGELSFEAGMITNGAVHKIGEGSLIPGWGGYPMDIADNGAIVGFDILLTQRRAWIKPAGQDNLVELKSYIQSLGAVVPSGLSLEVCQAISTDGRTIIGHGAFTGAWIVTLEYACNEADLAEPYGVLDFSDVIAFLTEFGTMGDAADLAEPVGVWDFSDVVAFLTAFGGGCP
ncbi:MAG: GC-type dockerin domain-anchored protein [Phycisphaerales bacterium]